ncbi:LacI family DNA-binding transcriptional regulator [Actinomyces radicidentis]|uniref:LacI family DNA-binding transcriptional regulator n=1 Tax=Actinomyces radicidentis TaxID=111015 RepID=UPI0028ECF522|nr:LacI family DNA-binding transcriptional regulator [Actinomyces radicidentis]
MPARATLSDVAAAAGVSSQTVSRVLHDHPSVRPETRSRVRAAIEALGYQPNLAARVLASGSSGAVGILLTAGLSHGMSVAFSALARAVREQGSNVVLATADGSDPASVRRALAHLHGYHVDRIVVLAQRTDVLTVLALEHNEKPVVAVISGTHSFTGFSTLSIDQALGARLATEHLIDLGRRRLVHVSGDLSWQDASERLFAYQSTCADHDLPARWIGTEDWSSASGAAVAERLLATGLPDGIFAANDDIALGICRVLLAAGVRVPDDVAVVGFDDIPQAAWMTPSLSTVAQDFDILGRTALSMSAELASGRDPRALALEPALIVRESTGGASV